MLTVTRSLLLWPERWHELATVLRQLDAGIAGQQVSDLIDESYSPDADDALNVITCADVANPTADPQLLRRQRQEINTAAMYAHYLPLHEYPLEMCDLWPYHGRSAAHAGGVCRVAAAAVRRAALRSDHAVPQRASDGRRL